MRLRKDERGKGNAQESEPASPSRKGGIIMPHNLLTALLNLALMAVLFVNSLPTDLQPAADTRARSSDVSGSLVIVGGGELPDSVRNRFLELAGGKQARLVIIPTASEEADKLPLMESVPFWKSQDVASVEFLHTRDPRHANDPAFVEPLTRATGVWMSGGDQSRLLEPYHGTLVEKELQNLLARGGVIGGTSAGASAMSAVMITGGDPAARVGIGFGLLPGVVIDQHFQNRNRLKRLLGVLATHPDCTGVGIDEQTAVVVQGHMLTVVGNANVRLCPPDSYLDASQVKVLAAGDHADLAQVQRDALARSRPAATLLASAPQSGQTEGGGLMAHVGTPTLFAAPKK
jgi:cyanophycinase